MVHRLTDISSTSFSISSSVSNSCSDVSLWPPKSDTLLNLTFNVIGGGDDAAVLDGGNGVVVLVDDVDVEYAII